MSKANNINNLFPASRMWGLTVTDVRISIVSGTRTEETRMNPLLDTQFDCGQPLRAQSLAGFPITVYGKGERKKPMITLEDAIRSPVRTVELPVDGGFHVYNQATMLISPKDLAHSVNRKKKTKPIRYGWKPPISKKCFSGATFLPTVIRDLKPCRHTLRTYSDRFMNA